MTKVAKLVTVMLVARVIVDENAERDEIYNAAKDDLIEQAKAHYEESLHAIDDDIDNPYSEDDELPETGSILIPIGDTIHYAGKDYPTRKFTILRDGDEEVITISVQSLSDALGDNKEDEGTEEAGIDEGIYFYVMDNEINNPAEFICKNLLDEPVEFLYEDED